MVLKHACTTSTGPPRQRKRLYLTYSALKHESMSIAQPLQLWKLYLWTFLVLKHACATSTTEKNDFETRVHEHRTISIVVEIVLVDILVRKHAVQLTRQ